MNNNNDEFKSAFVALIGRPNSGKSTLMNTVIGHGLSIVTSLPQTTRTVIRGIYNSPGMQLIFLDTPGIHRGKHALNKYMYAKSTEVLAKGGVDIVCYIVDLFRPFGEEEDAIAGMVTDIRIPLCIVFNKADICSDADKQRKEFFGRYPSLSTCPNISISATDASSKAELLTLLKPFVKPGPQFFPDDDITDSDMRFVASEFIRRRVIESTREEVPHAVCVEILTYRELPGRHEIDAAIHVESDGQKGIIIGSKGSLIKKIQAQAQGDISALVGTTVSLRCHIKVTPGWRDNPRFLKNMGFDVP